MAETPGGAKKRKLIKGRHISAIKRHRQNVKRADRNHLVISQLKSVAKKVRAAVGQKDAATVQGALREAMSAFAKAEAKGVIHKKTASRRISRLSQLVQKSAA